MTAVSWIQIESLAHRHGFQLVRPSALNLPSLETSEKGISDWCARGYNGDMAFLRRRTEDASAQARLLSRWRSAVVFAAGYDRRSAPPYRPGFGRVARYAWGRDYHVVLKRRLHALAEDLAGRLGRKIDFRIGCDALPLAEKVLAMEAGLGFIGRNNLLISGSRGSFFFLAELFLDFELEDAPAAARLDGGCRSCSACLAACPTGALPEEHLLDARLCISYLTIEKRGRLAWAERELLGEWVFGCDLCQAVCPHNAVMIGAEGGPEFPEFSAERGGGPWLDLTQVLGLRTDGDFAARFAGTSLMRAGREGLLRNAAAAAGNTAAAMADQAAGLRVTDALCAAAREDPSPIVRAHALWALFKHAAVCDTRRARGWRRLVERAGASDPAGSVVDEAARALSLWRSAA